jgi:anaerobic selenocysteine-containing dehydrogenase
MVKDYPLIMIDHRDIAYTHSEFRQLPSIRGRLPEQKIEINPQTAAELGIGEGDEIYIERPKFEHRVRGKAKFVPELHPKVISCLCLWWFPEKPSPEHGCFDANTNVFISIEPPYDPINGNYQVRGLLCRVGKLCS